MCVLEVHLFQLLHDHMGSVVWLDAKKPASSVHGTQPGPELSGSLAVFQVTTTLMPLKCRSPVGTVWDGRRSFSRLIGFGHRGKWDSLRDGFLAVTGVGKQHVSRGACIP